MGGAVGGVKKHQLQNIFHVGIKRKPDRDSYEKRKRGSLKLPGNPPPKKRRKTGRKTHIKRSDTMNKKKLYK